MNNKIDNCFTMGHSSHHHQSFIIIFIQRLKPYLGGELPKERVGVVLNDP